MDWSINEVNFIIEDSFEMLRERTIFPDTAGYQVVDSVAVKMIDALQTEGFRLFNYQVGMVCACTLLLCTASNGALY